MMGRRTVLECRWIGWMSERHISWGEVSPLCGQGARHDWRTGLTVQSYRLGWPLEIEPSPEAALKVQALATDWVLGRGTIVWLLDVEV